MNQYNPPIESRKTDELIIISKSTTDEWQADAIKIAKTQLQIRGYNQEEIDKRYNQLEKDFIEQIEKELAIAAKEDFNVFEKLWILFLWPREVFHGWKLRKQGYTLKAKRRIQLIALGVIFYIIIILYTF